MKKKIVSITILVLILLALIILYIDKSVYKEYSKNYIYKYYDNTMDERFYNYKTK